MSHKSQQCSIVYVVVKVTLLDGDGFIEGCSLRLLQTNYRVMMITTSNAYGYCQRQTNNRTVYLFRPSPQHTAGRDDKLFILNIEGGIFWCIAICGRHL